MDVYVAASQTISLMEVKAFIARILTYFTNKEHQLRSMLLCPNGIDYQNEIAIFVNDITNSTNRSNFKFKSLIEHIMKDPTHYPRVKIARFIKLLLAGGVICLEDLGITSDINLILPHITIKAATADADPAKSQKSSSSDSPRVSPPPPPKYKIPLCYTETNLISLPTILFLEIFLDNKAKLPAREENETTLEYAKRVLQVLHGFWEKFESGNVEYPILRSRTVKGSIPSEDLIALIDCTSTGYNLGRFNQNSLRKVIHEYLANLKLNEIIDLGKLPEDVPLSNIIVEMNHKLNHVADVDREDDKGRANFAVSWRPGDYGAGKEKINLGGKIVFRHLLYTCNLARRKIRTILALFHNLLTGVIPELDDLVSKKTVIGAIKQLDDIDRKELQDKFKNYADDFAGAWMFLLFDDTEISKSNRHVVHISYFDRDRDAPVLAFLSIGSTKSKGDDCLSKTDLSKIEKFHVTKPMVKGTTTDHCAISESTRLNKLLNNSSIWMAIGDGMHKVSLIGKDISIEAFGTNAFDEKDKVTKHHQQAIHDLAFAFG